VPDSVRRGWCHACRNRGRRLEVGSPGLFAAAQEQGGEQRIRTEGPPRDYSLGEKISMNWNKLCAICCLSMLLCPPGVADERATGSTAPESRIITDDIARFYALYDASDGKPSAAALQRYIDNGSTGLRVLAERRRVTGERIARSIADSPEIYANARDCTAALPAARVRLGEALAKLRNIYPQAHFPDVTIVIGAGRPVGIGYPDTGVQIGLEALCGIDYFNPDIEDRLVGVIAHEYVHVQQIAELTSGSTLLDYALAEGVAEFVGELISGATTFNHFEGLTAGREKAIEAAFLEAADETDLSGWMFDGSLEAPGDLGYWVGYRIAKAYYTQAGDKHAAVIDMLEATDARAFLEQSGWYPGIDLD
jgi:hypothetical protein